MHIDANLSQSIYLVPIIAFAEACPGVGLFVSGVILVGITSYLYIDAGASLLAILALAFCGAMAADHAGFYLGRCFGPVFHRSRLATQYPSSIARADDLVQRYGGAAIFIGRFIPAIRSIVPAAVGIAGTHRLRFSILDTFACAGWALGLGAILLGVETTFGLA